MAEQMGEPSFSHHGRQEAEREGEEVSRNKISPSGTNSPMDPSTDEARPPLVTHSLPREREEGQAAL